MKKPTLVNHPPDVSPPPGNRPVTAPIYQSVKFEFETVDDTLKMLRGEPLPPEVTALFLRTVASRRTADPEAAPRALREFLDRLVITLGLTPAQHTALRAFGTACLERLDGECSMLDPGAPVDPRYVSCLLLSPAAR